jgi:hypothetical protein
MVVGITKVAVYAFSSRCGAAFGPYCVGAHWNGYMVAPLTDERSEASISIEPWVGLEGLGLRKVRAV